MSKTLLLRCFCFICLDNTKLSFIADFNNARSLNYTIKIIEGEDAKYKKKSWGKAQYLMCNLYLKLARTLCQKMIHYL